MAKRIIHEYRVTKKSSYGIFHLLFDLFMTGITGGLWLIYLLIRFLRTH
jgi:hypothetical protein